MKYRCTTCRERKEWEAFPKAARNIGIVGRPGIRYECKECCNERQRGYNKKHPKKESVRQYRHAQMADPKEYQKYAHIKRVYGISKEELEALLEQQHGSCAICGNGLREGRGPESMVVDHDHTTNKIRGLLCRSCNGGLGFFKDNPEVIDNAARYLRL